MNYDNVFGDDEPIEIMLKELDRSKEFFKILSKGYKIKDKAKESIKNVKEMKAYIEEASYEELKYMIREIQNFQKMR